MASRVERYYDKNVDASKRSFKNRELYKTIYEDETYSNIEGIVETPRTNEIDIKKIQELLLKQEKENNSRNQLVKKNLEMPEMENIDDHDDKNYDIRDILAQAKEGKEECNRPRSLKDIDFDGIRQRLNNSEKYKAEDVEKDLHQLKELISTIAGNNLDLNKLADKELSLDMFSELAASTNELSSDDSDLIKRLISEAKKIEDDKVKEEEELEVDKSFYTSTLNLKKKDFESDEEEEQTSSTGTKILMILLFIVIALVAVVAGYNILK